MPMVSFYAISTKVYRGLLTRLSVNAIALAAIQWKYYIVFIVTDIIQVVIAYFIIVETRGLTLEDIAILFDGNDTLLSQGIEMQKAQTQ